MQKLQGLQRGVIAGCQVPPWVQDPIVVHAVGHRRVSPLHKSSVGEGARSAHCTIEGLSFLRNVGGAILNEADGWDLSAESNVCSDINAVGMDLAHLLISDYTYSGFIFGKTCVAVRTWCCNASKPSMRKLQIDSPKCCNLHVVDFIFF